MTSAHATQCGYNVSVVGTIDFPCACGHRFSLQPAMAGGTVQCPSCHRLLSVPTIGEHLAEDGTYIPIPLAGEPKQTIKTVDRAFGKTRNDGSGEAIDMRPTLIDLARAGIESQKLKPTSAEASPRYDPITGELMRPLDVAPSVENMPAPSTTAAEMPRQPIPVAKLAMTYDVGPGDKRVPPVKVMLELLHPVNFAVMLFVFVAHLAWFCLFTLAIPGCLQAGIPVWMMVLPLLLFVLPHYGNVIDEVGPEGIDELPRPMRALSWMHDLFGPLLRMLIGLLLCYWPAVAVLCLASERMMLGSVFLLVLGAVFTPAVLLTTVTSGGLVNLRPDRLLTVMRKLGTAYWGLVLFWAILLPLYAVALFGPELFSWDFRAIHPGVIRTLTPGFCVCMIGAAVYLAHLFFWLLGLIYRAHHEAFPWAMIEFFAEREREKARAAQAEVDKARAQMGLPIKQPVTRIPSATRE